MAPEEALLTTGESGEELRSHVTTPEGSGGQRRAAESECQR